VIVTSVPIVGRYLGSMWAVPMVPTSLPPGWRMVFLGSEAYRKMDAPAGTCSSGRCRWRWCWRGCAGGGGVNWCGRRRSRSIGRLV
jgi:hypothetical protein